MGKIVDLFNRENVPDLDQPNEALIEVLEKALKLAKDGSLQSFMGSGMTADGFRFSCHAVDKQKNYYEFLGSLVALIDEFKEIYDEQDDE